ncbi:MAG: hypothetical protein ABEH40_04690 [Haloferacaceae archaeon]
MTGDERGGRRGRAAIATLGLAAAGIVHVVAPDRLLAAARRGYRLLDVEFRPGPTATARVRLVGAGMLAVAALAWARAGGR